MIVYYEGPSSFVPLVCAISAACIHARVSPVPLLDSTGPPFQALEIGLLSGGTGWACERSQHLRKFRVQGMSDLAAPNRAIARPEK